MIGLIFIFCTNIQMKIYICKQHLVLNAEKIIGHKYKNLMKTSWAKLWTNLNMSLFVPLSSQCYRENTKNFQVISKMAKNWWKCKFKAILNQ